MSTVNNTYHPNFVSVVLPLAIPNTYTYAVPKELQADVSFGIRVEVPLRNKLYAGIVVEMHEYLETEATPKSILSLLDSEPIIHRYQYDLWQWMAKYYGCTIGEVMHVALPGGLRLSSETKLVLDEDFEGDASDLSDSEYLITEALTHRNELSIDEVKDLLEKKTIYPLIRSLIDKKIIKIKEELQIKFKPKTVGFVKLTSMYQEQAMLVSALDQVKKSDHQTKAILAYVTLAKSSNDVSRTALYEMSGVSIAVLKSLEKKGIFELYDKDVSRLVYEASEGTLPPLTIEQKRVIDEIYHHFEASKISLLHGVTGSGKTRIYMELINEMINAGKQVLYLLPEIALTTQIVTRLQHIFGEHVGIFHSRMNHNERVELWKDVLIGKKVILGARSSLFLPFSNLGLIIVDEEHDPSFKQADPNPRYNARDAAIYLSHQLKANVILGSATPSLESYANASEGKYGLVSLLERHGQVAMPDIEIVDLSHARKTGRINGHFTHRLIEVIDQALNLKEQIILFQNRRGYAPSLQCHVCGWEGKCSNCDVTLTYHKFFDELRCHYCGLRNKNPHQCPSCGNDVLEEKGFGTEKIEDEVQQLFPEAKVKRLDLDTTRNKHDFANILDAFGNKEIDILVGTQMVTKGFDFDNISVVGIINADSTLRFPDFRAGERAFQILTQVAGRAGRRKKQGKVIVQTYTPDHPVISEILTANYQRMFTRESAERKRFIYPPYYRMIEIQIKDKNPKKAEEAASYIAYQLKKSLGKRVIGPAQPGIARIKGFYLQNIVIKLEKDPKVIAIAKQHILHQKTILRTSDGFKSIMMKIDVDPY